MYFLFFSSQYVARRRFDSMFYFCSVSLFLLSVIRQFSFGYSFVITLFTANHTQLDTVSVYCYVFPPNDSNLNFNSVGLQRLTLTGR